MRAPASGPTGTATLVSRAVHHSAHPGDPVELGVEHRRACRCGCGEGGCVPRSWQYHRNSRKVEVEEMTRIPEHLHRYFFAADLAEGKRVLDLGSGEGYGSAILAERAKSVLGVELDPEAVRHASARYSLRQPRVPTGVGPRARRPPERLLRPGGLPRGHRAHHRATTSSWPWPAGCWPPTACSSSRRRTGRSTRRRRTTTTYHVKELSGRSSTSSWRATSPTTRCGAR